MKFSNNDRVPTDGLLSPSKTSNMRTRLHQGYSHSQRIVLIFLYLTMSCDPFYNWSRNGPNVPMEK